MPDERLNWDDYFLTLAQTASLRGDCRRRQVGAVLFDTKTHVLISTGYNGVRSFTPGCLEGACPRGLLSMDEVPAYTDYSDPESPGYCISSHAEMNCVLHAEQNLWGTSMAITDAPCPACKKMLFNGGLRRVIWPGGEFVWDTGIYSS